MRYTKLFGKTSKTKPADADSVNARLLTQAGFVDQTMAGVFSYLPLGLRVLEKISQIIREEMNEIGGQELLLPAIQPREVWEKTGRWNDFDALYKVKSHYDKEYALGPTHEEIIVPLSKRFIHSYRDLPLYVYQIQTKFRDEPRAKAGLLRGREFLMKDLYSFHTNERDLARYYEIVKKAYHKIFKKCGLDAICAEASGGTFSKFSHEFQVVTEAGEDTIFICSCGFARNKEIISDANIRMSPYGPADHPPQGDGGSPTGRHTNNTNIKCPKCGKKKLEMKRTSEVGNIFELKTKYSDPFKLIYLDKNGKPNPVMMGCYGIGVSRIMATVVEVYHDKDGIVWPVAIAPYQVHLIEIPNKFSPYGGWSAGPQIPNSKFKKTAEVLYNQLVKEGVEVLYDERDVSPGEKFADADLIGCPVRLVVSEKTLAKDSVEVKKRGESKTKLVKIKQVVSVIAKER